MAWPRLGRRDSNANEVAILEKPTRTSLTLAETLEKYDLVEAHTTDVEYPFLIVSQRAENAPIQLADKIVPNMSEIGTASPSPFTSWARREYNPKLLGLQGLREYDKMRKSDATVRGTLRLVKTPVLAARWFMEPADKSTRAKNVADVIWWNLTQGMSIGWPQLLTEALLMCDFGYYMYEKVWDDTMKPPGYNKPYLGWKKLAPRHPMDVISWAYDINGGPSGVWMYPNNQDPMQKNIFIPIDKLLVFSFDREAGNIEGISVLRSAFKHWYFKDQLYKIDAIQKERHGIGIPVIVLPPGFTGDDKRAADELGRNLRTNERAHVVLPPNWTLEFAKLQGQPVDAMKSIEHHNASIRENVLAGFLGSDRSTVEEDQTMFLKATRFIADIVCDTFNQYAIPQLVDANFSRVGGYPRLRARRIGELEDWRTLSFAIRNLIGAGVIRPDDPLEEVTREEMDLPAADPKTMRVTGNVQERIQIQNPQPGNGIPAGQPTQTGQPTVPQPGLPRQKPLPPVGTPRNNAGTDRSGGR